MPEPYAGRHRATGDPAPPTPGPAARRAGRTRVAGITVALLATSAGGYLTAGALAADRPAGVAVFDLTAASSLVSAAEPAGLAQPAEPGEPTLLLELADPSETVLAQRVRAREAAAARAQLAAAQAEAARLQAARQAEAERAAREAQRAAVLAHAQQDPRAVAAALVAERGWDASQMQCLDRLWTKESQWSFTATNRSSGAYGIPQALPGSKMGSVAPDWRTNPVTQITWGLNYIAAVYGTPCKAWSHSQGYNWY